MAEWIFKAEGEVKEIRIREYAHFGAKEVGFLEEGCIFMVTEKSGEWVKVIHNGIEGWSVTVIGGKRYLVPLLECSSDDSQRLEEANGNEEGGQNELLWVTDILQFTTKEKVKQIFDILKQLGNIPNRSFYDLEPKHQEYIINLIREDDLSEAFINTTPPLGIPNENQKIQLEAFPLWAEDLISIFRNERKQVKALLLSLSPSDRSKYFDCHLDSVDFEFQAKVIDMLSSIEDSKQTEYLSFDQLYSKYYPSEDEQQLKGIRVAILNGKGCFQGSARCFELICNKEIEKQRVSGEGNIKFVCKMEGVEIASGCLRFFDVLCVPGGDHEGMMDDLGPSGQLEIRKFIQSGGGYFGVCGGLHFQHHSSSSSS